MNFGARNLKFDSSWGFRIFSLSYALDKTKKKHLCLFLKFYKTEISSNFLNSKRLFSGLFTHQMNAPWETKIEIENPQIEYADGKTNSFLDSLFSAFLAAKVKEPDASFSFKGREKLGKLEKIHKNKFLR